MADNKTLKVLLCDTVEITTANVVLNKTDLNIVPAFIKENVGQYKLSFNLNNNNMSEQTLTFGQKAVGITFNPSGDEGVIKVKQLSADIIDILNEYKNVKTEYGNKQVSWTTNVLFTAAFNAVIAAQMAVVKYLTWQD